MLAGWELHALPSSFLLHLRVAIEGGRLFGVSDRLKNFPREFLEDNLRAILLIYLVESESTIAQLLVESSAGNYGRRQRFQVFLYVNLSWGQYAKKGTTF